MKRFLAAVTKDDLDDELKSIGQPAFRCRQILDWIYRKRQLVPEQMQNIPRSLRSYLEEHYTCSASTLVKVLVADDQTAKLLIRLHDGECVEAVIIPSEKRTTFCLSTQVGCPVGCYFCASGSGGLIRNMDAGEIIEQFSLVVQHHGELPGNVVFMGIGEGLLNFSNLKRALLLLTGKDYVGFGSRRVTVSTSGWTPGIYKLADCCHQWNLAISLHAPNDDIRAKIIPGRYRKPVAEIIKAAEYYNQTVGRMVTFEYTLLDNLNDGPEQAVELAGLARKVHAKVNLIPFNSISRTGANSFAPPSADRIDQFMKILAQNRVSVTVRKEKGASIAAACGQLRLIES